MATVIRRFGSITQENGDPGENASDWSPTGAASLAVAVGATSDGTTIYAAGVSSDLGSIYTKRLLLTDPSVYLPLFSTITAVAFTFEALVDDDAPVTLIGFSGNDHSQHRAWAVANGDTFNSASSGTTSGLRTNTISTITTLEAEYTHSTWQASGVTNYLGSNAGRLNSGWTHGVTARQDDVGTVAWRLWAVTETITYTAPTAPAAFAVTSPANAATDVSRTPTLDWAASTRAVHYRVVVSLNSDLSSPIIDTTTTAITLESATADSEYAISSALLPNTTYYWTVYARNYADPSGQTVGTTPQDTQITGGVLEFTTAVSGGWRTRERNWRVR